jgi:hypothetical protein
MAAILTSTGITFSDGTSTNTNLMPAGTLMLFQQTSAPVGWTKQTLHDNKSLRVVTGTASSGGSIGFTTFFNASSVTPSGTVNNTTLAANQLGNHTHSYAAPDGALSGLYAYGASRKQSSNFNVPSSVGANSGGINEGSGTAHNHGFTGTAMNFAVQYVDLIIASKN